MHPHNATSGLATPDMHGALVALCVAAFADEPLAAWLHPDHVERETSLNAGFDHMLREGIRAKRVTVVVSPTGVPLGTAFWQAGPPADEPPITGTDPLSRRLRAVQQATASRRPRRAHRYLPSMAVHPDERGRGLGGALLATVIEHAAAANKMIYLEASSIDNRRFYTRHGFRSVGDQLVVADDAPALHPMALEPPRPVPPASI
ncbi:MAG: GNAT family N-acetyltransferase [Pseudoclavibacter sp.]